MTSGAEATAVPANLDALAATFQDAPAIFRRVKAADTDEDMRVPGWPGDPSYRKPTNV